MDFMSDSLNVGFDYRLSELCLTSDSLLLEDDLFELFLSSWALVLNKTSGGYDGNLSDTKGAMKTGYYFVMGAYTFV